MKISEMLRGIADLMRRNGHKRGGAGGLDEGPGNPCCVLVALQWVNPELPETNRNPTKTIVCHRERAGAVDYLEEYGPLAFTLPWSDCTPTAEILHVLELVAQRAETEGV